MWGTPGADGSVPGMEMTPNSGMMMDPNAAGDAALAGGRPHMGGPGRGTSLCCGRCRWVLLVCIATSVGKSSDGRLSVLSRALASWL